MHGARELKCIWLAYRESSLLAVWLAVYVQDPLPGLEELGEPQHGLLLHRHVAREHVPVADQRWLVHSYQQHLPGQGVREGIWLTAACQGTLLARIKVTKVTPDASICSGPQGQKKRGLSPSEHTDLWLGLVTVGVYNVINFGLCFLNR